MIIPIHIKMKNKLFFINYKLWFWIGHKCRFLNDYNLSSFFQTNQKSLTNAYNALEDAFEPQLQKLIEDGWCSECGVYRGEDV